MMVSTKGRYALIVCLDLAQQDPVCGARAAVTA